MHVLFQETMCFYLKCSVQFLFTKLSKIRNAHLSFYRDQNGSADVFFLLNFIYYEKSNRFSCMLHIPENIINLKTFCQITSLPEFLSSVFFFLSQTTTGALGPKPNPGEH